MSKMKKVLLMCTAYVLVAALAIGGTVAYLQSEDSDVNVMTLGNVSIRQNEEQRVDPSKNGTLTDADIEDFEQAKPLYPYVDENLNGAMKDDYEEITFPNGKTHKLFIGDNAIDKLVSVTNTGKTDAYVRTIVALEAPTNKIDLSFNSSDWSMDKTASAHSIEVDGVKYDLFVCVYKNVLKPGETTPYSLMQIILDGTATNEDAAAYGDTYDVLVLSQAVQADGFDGAAIALDTAFGDVTDVTAAEWFGGVIAEHIPDTWDGTMDFALFGLMTNEPTSEELANVNLVEDEYVIGSAEEFAAFAKLVDAGETFEGKTVSLGKNIDLENKLFDPIGSYRNDTPFKGTFDGQGYSIQNLSQNTWELNNGYYYGDLGLGLFGKVEDATVKNLVMDGASISGESAICGIVAAAAYGDCTFENITVKNSQAADYQYYAGGVVGWASGNHTYKNINVDASTTIAAQWGDFDNSTGGVIGGAGSSATILMKDCNVACRIDAYNDVTSSYQWYAYRRCGMLIGNPGNTVTEGSTTYAAAPQLTCENVTVIYGDWANYTYCEFAGQSWPYVRVQAGISNSAYSNPRYGHPTDANGNEVVDDNHVHNVGEDHFIKCTFDQLYGGGQGVYGDPTHDGVTVIYNNK